MAKPEPYFVGIDIGSSKVGVLIGQRDDKGGIEVVGKGLAPNRGTRKGNIVNVEATVEALKQASEEAEVMAGVEISRAFVGISGPDIRSVHLKDGRRPTTPGHWGEEVPLGQGEVDIPRFLAALKSIGYTGPLMIEREVGDQAARIRDIADGLDFVREHLSTS